MIVEQVNEYMSRQIKQYPCNSNRASSIGHPCERYLVFERTRWSEKTLHDVSLQFIFNEGNVQEKAVLDLLSAVGIQVIEQQRSFAWRLHNITGHIDGKVLIDRECLPLEIKSMSPYVFESINTADDLLHSKYEHLRRYPAQLTMYMLMDEKDRALFLFKNKSTGQLKEILLPLDYFYAETIIQKIERVNHAIDVEETPAPMPWGDTCERCGYRHICIQEVVRTEMEIRDDPEAEKKIDRWFELDPLRKEWADIDGWRKEYFRNIDKMVVGNYLILGKETKAGWKSTISQIER